MPSSVNPLDDFDPPLLDHIGWRLWLASRAWEQRFQREMVAAGHAWFEEARATLIPHIARAGTPQSDLVRRTALTKQAVQQLVDGLVEDGIVERRPDPADARAKRVCFTRKGLRVLADANRIKQQIEADYRQQLGDAGLRQLHGALVRLLDMDSHC